MPNVKKKWTFLTNHGAVFIYIAKNQRVTTRDIAGASGITERAVQLAISDLCDAGYVIKLKEGRRNSYKINPSLPLRHRLQINHSVGDLLTALQ